MKKLKQTVQSILRGAMAFALVASSFLYSGTVKAQDINVPAGDVTLIRTEPLPPPGGMRAPIGGGGSLVVGTGAVLSNITTFTGQFFANGGAANLSGNTITTLVANHYTLVGTPPFGMTAFTFSVANADAATVSARYRVRFYLADGAGGGPGTAIGGFSFNAIAFTAGSISLFNANVTALSLTSNDIWVGWTFDNNTGATGATIAQMNNLGMGLFNPVDLGTGYDAMFQTGAAGSFLVNNPSGTVTASPFGGSPVGMFSFEVRVPCVTPGVVCPGDMAVNTSGSCGAVATYSATVTGTAPDVTYALSGATTASGSGTGSGETFNVGITNVTITATSLSGCGSGNCTFLVTVSDNEAPVITCPANESLNTDAGSCTATSSGSTATATDNCSVSSITVDNAGPYSVGTTTVVWTATDVNGVTSTCSQDITVTDAEVPVITCPANESLNTDAGSCTAFSSPSSATSTDNCAGVATTVDNAGPYSVGTTTVVWTATDANGNTASCSQDIMVTDAEAPVITCPANESLNTDAGSCTAASSPSSAAATDNCTVASTTVDNAGPYSVGTTTVVWTSTDVNGNMSTCSQDIMVTDNEAPVITCPSNESLNTDAGSCTATSSGSTATATDNCTVASTTVDNAGPYSVGTTTVVWTSTDINGNMATCSQDIMVTDAEAPVITCPSNESLSTDAFLCTATSSGSTATATDNCSVSSTTVDNPGPYSLGTTTIVWTATDVNGNMSTCSQDITVTDMEVPTILCPPAAGFNTDAGLCTSSAFAGTASSSDNCSVASVTVDNAGPYSVGTTTVVWTSTDVNGNMATCSQDITIFDVEAPVITCPSNESLNTDAGMCTATSSGSTATATDNCTVASTTVDNAGPYSVGTTTVVWTSTDINGNMATCSQDIMVTDAEAPVITCPGTENLNTDAGSCTAASSPSSATATDNCSVMSTTVDNAGPYSVGTTTVVWTSTDVNGNMATCSQDIMVTDAEAPVITCPSNASLSTDAGACTSSSSAGTATATDNCTVASTTVDNAGPYSVGTTTVVWTSTDVNGNMATCSQDIMVTDSEVPTITAPADVTVCAGATITLGTPTVSDNCGTPTFSNDAPGVFPLGLTIVTWVATDASGNTSSAAQNVTVNATPVGTPASMTICDGSSVAYDPISTIPGSTFSWTAANTFGTILGFNDCASGCTSITDVLSNLSGFGGIVDYTVTATSPGGCASAPFVVSVTVATVPVAPVITGTFTTCGLGSVTFTGTSLYATTYTWVTPLGITITSGAGTSVITCSTTGFTNPGTMTLTTSNACGSSTTTSQLITKKPQPATSISGPASVCGLTTATYSVAASLGATTYNWQLPAGMTMVSGAGTTQITVNIVASSVLGNMRVDAVNACGYVVGPIMFITGHAPATPGTLSGPTNVCGLTTATYSIPSVVYSTGYTWTVPAWMTITGGAGTTSITVSVTGTPAAGSVSVAATNVCGTGTARVRNLVVSATIPGAITGPANICGMTTAAYSVASLGAGYTYNWTLAITAWTITSGAGTSMITCSGPSIGAVPVAGLVKVTSTNACGMTSGIRTKAVTYCHGPLAISSNENASFSAVYPNPANTEFKIDVTSEMEQEITLAVYDVTGRLVASSINVVNTGTTTISTSIENYKAGMYFVRLVDGNSSTVYSQTVIKQ